MKPRRQLGPAGGILSRQSAIGPLGSAAPLGPDFTLSAAFATVGGSAGSAIGSIVPDSGTIAAVQLTNDAGGRFALSGQDVVIGSVSPTYEAPVPYRQAQGDLWNRGLPWYLIGLRVTYADGSVRSKSLPIRPRMRAIGATGAGEANPQTATALGTGAGSLRNLAFNPGADTRTIVIDPWLRGADGLAGAYIDLKKKNNTIRGHDRYIAGKDGGFRMLEAENYLIEHLALAAGAALPGRDPSSRDAFEGTGGLNIILRHCQFLWSIDELLSFFWFWSGTIQPVRDVLIEHCILAEPLTNGGHSEGSHPFGLLLAENCMNVVIRKNVILGCRQRSPEIGQSMGITIENNVIAYGSTGAVSFRAPSIASGYRTDGQPPTGLAGDPLGITAVIRNNLLVPGFNGGVKGEAFVLFRIGAGSEIYQAGNHFVNWTGSAFDFADDPVVTASHTLAVQGSTLDSFVTALPFEPHDYGDLLPTGTAAERQALFAGVLAEAGVRGRSEAGAPILGDIGLSEIGARIISGFRAGVVNQPATEADVGGFVWGLPKISIADTAAAGALVTTLVPPAGHTPELLMNAGGRFALSGNDIVVGSTLLQPYTTERLLVAFTPTAPQPGQQAIFREFCVTVTAARTPATVAGASLLTWHRAQDAVVTTGNDIDSIPGAYGTAVALTGGFSGSGVRKPQRLAGAGPQGRDLIQLIVNTDKAHFTMPGQVLTDFSMAFVVGPRVNTTIVQALFGSSGSEYIAFNSNGANSRIVSLSVRLAGMAGATTISFPAAGQIDAAIGLQALICTFNNTTKAFTVYSHDRSIVASATLTGATGITITNVLRNGTGGASNHMGAALIAEFGLFNAVLSAAEIDALFAYLSGVKGRDFHFDPAGDNANTGFNASQPRRDTTGLSTYGFAPGDRFLFRGGVRHTLPQRLTFLSSFHGLATLPCVVAGYGGNDEPPELTLAATVASGWSDNGDGTWSIALATAPNVVIARRAGQVDAETGMRIWQPLYDRAVSSDWSRQWAAGTLTCRFESGFTPNGADILIESTAGAYAGVFDYDRNYFDHIGFDVIAARLDAIRPRGTGNNLLNVRGSYSPGDIFTLGGSQNVYRCIAFRQGLSGASNFIDTSTSADGITYHGSSNAAVRGCIFKGSESYGAAHQPESTVASGDNSYLDNAKQVVLLANVSGGGGAFTFRRDRFRRPAVTTDGTNTFDDAIRILSTATVNVTVENCRFEGGGTTRGKAINRLSATGSLTQSGNAQTGFNSLT